MNPIRSESAFPTGGVHTYRQDNTLESVHFEGGMTLRDYFAAKAMQAQITTAAAPCVAGYQDSEPAIATAAYAMADAMLKAREQ